MPEKFIPCGTLLVVEFSLEEKMRAIRAASKVAWAKSHCSGYRFEIGSRFAEGVLTGSDLTVLKAIIAKLSKD